MEIINFAEKSPQGRERESSNVAQYGKICRLIMEVKMIDVSEINLRAANLAVEIKLWITRHEEKQSF